MLMNIINEHGALILALIALAAGLLAALFVIRTVVSCRFKKSARLIARQAIAVVLFAAITVSCTVGSFQFGDGITDEEQQLADGSETLPQEEPLPDVNLTERQIQKYLEDNDFSLVFDDSSLASRAPDRIAAYQAAGVDFTDGIAMPYENANLIVETYKTLSAEAKQEQLRTWSHQLRQDIIANPVVGIAWLELIGQIPLIQENNSYWISPNLEVIDKLFAGTYEQPQTSDKDYQEKVLVELNNLPKPKDVTSRGLDYLLVQNGAKTEVRMTWARLAVRICAVLDYFEAKVITYRTSIANMHMPPIAEDSMCRAEAAPYQESRAAMLMVFGQKNGAEGIALGSNLFDRRPEQFGNTPEPVVQTPPKTTTPPKTDPPKNDTPDPEPEKPTTPPAPVTYKVTFDCRERGTNALLLPTSGPMAGKANWTITSQLAETQRVDAPVIDGYTPEETHKLVNMEASNGQTLTFWYSKTQTEPANGVLLIRYVDENGRRMDGMEDHRETLPIGASYAVKSPVAPRGWELKDQSQSTVRSERYGTMVGSGITIDVVYRKVATTVTATVEYLYEDGSRLYSNDTHSGLTPGSSYRYTARECPRNYWVDPEVHNGTVPDHDFTVTFIYHYHYLSDWKDPKEDPVNQGNAPIGGGENLPTDGTGEFQPTEEPRTDHPEEGRDKNPSGRPDVDPSTGNSNVNLPAGNDQPHESSGQGKDENGYQKPDHNVVDPNGGMTDNGTPAEKNPIEVNPGTTVTDDNTGATSSTGSGGDSGSGGISGSIAAPD